MQFIVEHVLLNDAHRETAAVLSYRYVEQPSQGPSFN